jgi:DNA topoisomerase I
LSLRVGKFGAFIGCSNYPECRFTRQFSDAMNGNAEGATPEGKLLGYDPDTALPVTLRTGRFGPYVQLGDGTDDDKPKRASVPKGIDAATIDLERALQLLSLPREIGTHPETGQPITASIGRYGPFVHHEGVYANLESVEDVFTIGINRAVVLFAEKAAGGGGKKWSRPQAQVLKDLGEHPEGGKIEVLSGRYGPYVKHGTTNATLPKGKDPAALTVAEAVELLSARAARNGGKPAKAGRARASAKNGKAKPTRKAAEG